MSFIQHMGRDFGTQQVTVIHQKEDGGEERHALEAQVQAKKAFFDIDSPVYEDDQMELDDPRGGIRAVWITDLKLNQAGGQLPSYMSHIAATFSDQKPVVYTPTAHQIIHGDAIIISGNNVNVATRGSSVTQQPVSAGYEDLARAVKKALELIDADSTIDADERTGANESSSAILEELVKDQPDRAKLRSALAMLRGVLVAGANAAAAATASGLVHQLMLPN